MHSVQLKLLSSKISTAADTHHKGEKKRAVSRKVLLKNLDNHLLTSVIFVLRNRVRNDVVSSEQPLQGKLAKLSESQDKPLRSSIGGHRQFDRNLRKNKLPGEKLFEIERAAKWYSKNIRETPLDGALAKVQKCLRNNALIAVPFDNCLVFCARKKSTYAEKLEKILDCEQFRVRT